MTPDSNRTPLPNQQADGADVVARPGPEPAAAPGSGSLAGAAAEPAEPGAVAEPVAAAEPAKAAEPAEAAAPMGTPELAHTGTSALIFGLTSVLLVGAGAAALRIRRRRA